MDEMKTVVFLSNSQNQTVTFFRPFEKNFYVGYRFLEGHPEISGDSERDYTFQPVSTFQERVHARTETVILDAIPSQHKGWETKYDAMEGNLQARLKFITNLDGSAYAEIAQLDRYLDLGFYFQPVQDGIQIILRVHSTRGIAGSCLIQQCLRFTGSFNQEWRTEITHVPFLSEFDMQAMGRPNSALTFYLKNGHWVNFPVQHTILQTKVPGYEFDGDLIADHGLIIILIVLSIFTPLWMIGLTALAVYLFVISSRALITNR